MSEATGRNEMTYAKLRAISDWQAGRQARIDAAAGALHHLNAALSAGAGLSDNVLTDIRHARQSMIGHLRAVIEETNPNI